MVALSVTMVSFWGGGGGEEAPILKGGLLVVPVKAIKTGFVTSYGVRVLSRKEYDKRR